MIVKGEYWYRPCLECLYLYVRGVGRGGGGVCPFQSARLYFKIPYLLLPNFLFSLSSAVASAHPWNSFHFNGTMTTRIKIGVKRVKSIWRSRLQDVVFQLTLTRSALLSNSKNLLRRRPQNNLMVSLAVSIFMLVIISLFLTPIKIAIATSMMASTKSSSFSER